MKEASWMLRYARRHSLSLRRYLSNWKKELKSWQRFWQSYHQYRQLTLPEQEPSLDLLYPCLGDDTNETVIEPTYFYQDAWAFEQIVKAIPSHHIDVGSHHKFVALLSKVFPVSTFVSSIKHYRI
jgi:hypothetical protein